MAEIATNVLHNVGNVLNSVNISADLVARKLRTSKALGLGKAMQLINEHPDDLGTYLRERRKRQTAAGLPQPIGGSLAVEQQGLTDELAQLSKASTTSRTSSPPSNPTPAFPACWSPCRSAP